MSDKNSGKRLVTRDLYLRIEGKRFALTTAGYACLLLGALGSIFSGLALCWLFPILLLRAAYVTLALKLMLIATGGALFAILAGLDCMGKATRLERVELLTPDKIDALPARESLVRASQEPIQEQQAVLLRATLTQVETPAEQLLRPTNRASGNF